MSKFIPEDELEEAILKQQIYEPRCSDGKHENSKKNNKLKKEAE